MAQVKEEVPEVKQSNDETDYKENLEEDRAMIPQDIEKVAPVTDEELSKRFSKIQQQRRISGTTTSSTPIRNMAVISDYDDNDDDGSDEFYDASSDFNEVVLSSGDGVRVTDSASVKSSTIPSSQNGKIISFH